VLDRLVTVRGRAPRFIRCDNGPELTANALRDWCRFTGAGTSYVEYNTVRPHSALGYLTPDPLRQGLDSHQPRTLIADGPLV
jgi:transposase InsO family protein